MRTLIAASAAAALLSSSPPAMAQERCAPAGEIVVEGLGTPDDDQARVAELASAVAPASRLIRRGGVRREPVCAGATFPWAGTTRRERRDGADAERAPTRVRPHPLRLTSVWNSHYPSTQNDALLWAGRGLAQHATAGASFRLGWLSGAVAPEVAWSENRAFDLVPNGKEGALRFENAYYPGGIDLPQRFGVGPFAAFGPGQSFLRADRWNVALGLSTENLWLGPGLRSSVVMSNAGPGFPHAFLGTTRPADVWIGEVEALAFWGRLERTRFTPHDNHPLITGLALGFEPRWVPGLHLGLGRVLLQRWDDLGLREWLAIFQPFSKKALEDVLPGGNNPSDNQIAAVYGRWAFPDAGLEVYGEWARDDHDWTWWGFAREPDRSSAWVLGLQKVFRSGGRIVRVQAELADLEDLTGLVTERPTPVYYVHDDLGYTHEGQPLGAWIGPSADSQALAIDVFHRGGRIGGYLERVRRNERYYWTVIEPARGSWPHDAELTLGVRQVLATGSVEVSWDAAASFRQNRDFIRDEPNFRLGLGLALPLAPSR